MGDLTIAQDLLGGVEAALAEVGATRVFKYVVYSAVNPLAPGAAPTETPVNVNVETLLFDFDIKYMPDSSVEEGNTLALFSIIDFTAAQKAALIPGNFLVDGSVTYTISKVRKIEASGVLVTVILQLKD